MQFVADDLDVRALLLQHRERLFAHRLPEGIILIDEVDLLDVGRPFMKLVSAAILMSELASQRKCQYEHLSLVSTGSTAA